MQRLETAVDISEPKDNKWAVPREKLEKHWDSSRKFIVENFLPLIFCVALTWALAWPYPGKVVVEVKGPHDTRVVQEVNMIIVFFLSGVALRTDDISKAVKHSRGLFYGIASNLLFSPILGFVYRVIPLNPREFSLGLAVFCVVPTTLGVGVALVRSCSGNEGLALLLTVSCNLLGVASMPLLVRLVLLNVSGLNLDIDILGLFVRLVVTVLAPSVIGKGLRDAVPAIRRFATKYKVELGMFSTLNLAIIIWQNLSGARDKLFQQSATDIVAVIFLGISQHLTYLLFNGLVLRYLLPMPPPEAVAVWIVSSQKSAPVFVTIASFMAKSTASLGFMVIPAVVGQLFQIFMGAILARQILPRMEAWKRGEAARAAAGPGAPANRTHDGAPPSSGGEGAAQPSTRSTLPAPMSSDHEVVVLDLGVKDAGQGTATTLAAECRSADGSGALAESVVVKGEGLRQQGVEPTRVVVGFKPPRA